MAVKHREYPVYGVQFHPESILSEHGKDLLANFLRSAQENASEFSKVDTPGAPLRVGAAQAVRP